MEEKSYYNCDFKCWYEQLGEDGRKEFMEWMGTFREYKSYKSSSINYDFGTSYCNDLYRVGRTLVYLYTDKYGIPFYVGKGDSNRAVSIYNRPEAFKEKLREVETCRIFAIAFEVTNEDALHIETLAINELLSRGWKLLNQQKTVISQKELMELRDIYPEVINTLNNISSKAMDYLLMEIDPFGDKGEVVVGNKTRVKPIKHKSQNVV